MRPSDSSRSTPPQGSLRDAFPRTTGAAAVDILRDAIRKGYLPPGTALVQRTLAEVLGLSKIPVREAMRELAAEGLVTFTAGQGAVVTQLSADEIDDLYSLRILIEPALSESIVGRCTAAEILALDKLVHDMDRYVAEERRAEWHDTNFSFHDQLYQAARRPHFHRVAMQFVRLTELHSRFFVFELGGLAESQHEHHEMIKAIRNGDAKELEFQLEKHLGRARVGLLQYLAATSGVGARDGTTDNETLIRIHERFARAQSDENSRKPAVGPR